MGEVLFSKSTGAAALGSHAPTCSACVGPSASLHVSLGAERGCELAGGRGVNQSESEGASRSCDGKGKLGRSYEPI